MNARHSLAFTIAALSLVAVHARADSDRDRERDRDRDRTTTVDCAAGDTVARALTRGDERKSLTILINGSCSEHVVINRSDIKLAAAAPGATISGPDPAIDVIRVTGTRVTLDGITVTGGRNGITADGAAGLIVQNALVQGTGRNGISYAHGASGVVDGCRVLNNARDGVAVDAASGSVINSQVSQNAAATAEARRSGLFIGGSLLAASRCIVRPALTGNGRPRMIFPKAHSPGRERAHHNNKGRDHERTSFARLHYRRTIARRAPRARGFRPRQGAGPGQGQDHHGRLRRGRHRRQGAHAR